MLRLSPPGHLRVEQTLPGSLEAAFAGAEANVAVTIARLGGAAEFITALPSNEIGDAALAVVRATGVEVARTVRSQVGRCGIYFVESGAAQRGGTVLYDRAGSTFSLTAAKTYPWQNCFSDAGWFHTTGIAAAVSLQAAQATHEATLAARRAGLTVSFDVNFRRKLWQWELGTRPADLARRVVREITKSVDVLIGNPFDLAALIDGSIQAEVSASQQGVDQYVALARLIGAAFPHLRWVAMTLRENHSASCNRWGALLFRPSDGAVFAAPGDGARYRPYEITSIVDRVGTGDAFAGALIFALQTPELAEPARAIAFAVAAGCLAHSTKGDFFCCSRAETEALSHGEEAGHISR